MNETVVDILIYLYENYMDEDVTPPPDHNALREELLQAGFSPDEIGKAFRWLDELAEHQEQEDHNIIIIASQATKQAMRIYAHAELMRLDADCRGFLLFLEQNDILNQETRELTIERVLALDSAQVTVEDLKWVVLLVLMNQPGQEVAFARMEDLVYNELPSYLH